jgi:hypothetical protein
MSEKLKYKINKNLSIITCKGSKTGIFCGIEGQFLRRGWPLVVRLVVGAATAVATVRK